MSQETKSNMEQTHLFGLNIKNTLPFIGMRWISFAISGVIIIAGLVTYITRGGFTMGIDFKGGVKIEAQIDRADISIKDVRLAYSKAGKEADVNTVGTGADSHYMITLPVHNDKAAEDVAGAKSFLEETFGAEKVKIIGSELVEAKIGKDFSRRALYLIFIVAGLILLYVIFRFDFFYGAGALGALFHDILVMLSFALFFNISIDITIIAAILTILGYSINDTIVVFDRVRETHKLNQEENYAFVMDKSITQTLNRTIITSLTTFFVVLALYLWGGLVLKNFSFMLMVGIIDGTYSSIFIAAPITYLLRNAAKKGGRKEKKETVTA